MTVEELLDAVGQDLGTSPWRRVGQDDIDAFAAATGDDQWIHVDPVRAAEGPFGRPVAHGYLLLALLPELMRDVVVLSDKRLAINYGVDRIRFTAPVVVDSQIRVHARLADAQRRGEGILIRVSVELEIEDSEKPALVGDINTLIFS